MRAKYIFENFDTQEDKERYSKFFSKQELDKMTDLKDYENNFRYGAYHGKDSVDLNDKIHNAMYPENFDAIGAKEIMYKIMLKEIPQLKTFKVNENHFQSKVHYLNLQKEVHINKKLDDDYSIKINLWLTYIAKEDELMDYRENTFKFLFTPNITVTRTSIGLHELDKNEDILKNIDNDKELNKFMNTLSKKLYGSPDKDDSLINKNLSISIDNISIEDFKEILILVKQNLEIFNKYIKRKYGISI
jgi:hypothetical protein